VRFPARTKTVAPALAALALFAGAPAPARAQSPADTAAARELFVEGSTLAEQGRWDEARERFERSLRLKRASLTLYSLGVAERQTGRLVEARESFLAFLSEAPTPATKPFERPAREALEELNKRIARIRVKVIPPGVPGLTIDVDGVPLHPAMFDQPRPINPGAHSVTIAAPGYRPNTMRQNAEEGEEVIATLSIEPDLEPGRPSPVLVQPRLGSVVPIVLIGSGLATFAAGLATGLSGVIDSSGAPTSNGQEASNARSKALVGDIIGGTGLAVAGIGAVILIVQASGGPKPVSTVSTIAPWASGSTAGVRFRF
jgi:hypothetical protein